MYDVAIIGAGPAGLFAAHTLSNKGLKVVVLDKGRDILKRKCKSRVPRIGCRRCKVCDIMCGVGGAGAFSDGKLNLSTEIGMDLNELGISEQRALKLISQVDDILQECGANGPLFGNSPRVREWVNRTAKVDSLLSRNHPGTGAGVKLIPALQRHMGTDRTPAVISNLKRRLEAAGIEFRTNYEVRSISKPANYFVIKCEPGTINARQVIAAPGRGGAYWFRDLAKRLGLPTSFGPIDVGVRVELLSKDMEEITSVIYDPKFRIVTPTYRDQVRTFCTNPGGQVTLEYVDGLVLVNGHALSKKRGPNTNFALLYTIHLTEPVVDTTEYGRVIARFCNFIAGGKPLLQRLGDLRQGRRSRPSCIHSNEVRPSYEGACCGDLGLGLGHRVISNIKEGLEILNLIIPGVSKDSTLLYAPEVKFYDTKYRTNSQLETPLKGLFVAGDGCGKSRGIMGAAVTGIIAAEGVLGRAQP